MNNQEHLNTQGLEQLDLTDSQQNLHFIQSRKEEEEQNNNHFVEFDEVHLNLVNSMNYGFEDSGAIDIAELTRVNDQTFEDASYRSIGVLQEPMSLHMPRSLTSDENGAHVLSQQSKAGMMIENKKQDAPKSALRSDPVIKVTSNDTISVPVEPFYVAPSTNFVIDKIDINVFKAQVEMELDKRTGVSYSFFPAKCRWEGVYLAGSMRCKFEINVYRRPCGGLIVEGNRLSGESMAFVDIYRALRESFVDCEKISPFPLLPNPGFRETSPSDIDNSIDAVLSMADSGICEAQLGASQIFCDIFSLPETANHTKKLAECLDALVKLSNVEYEFCNQHAICALAELSTSRTCQEVLLRNKKFMKTLLANSSDGNYNTIEMRRECARMLANISCCGDESHAQQIVKGTGVNNVEAWLQSVDDLKDERLRMHADRARESLSRCIAISS
jgi:hypothetical protein